MAMKVSGGENVRVPIEAVRVLIDVVLGSIEAERVLIQVLTLHQGIQTVHLALVGAHTSILPRQPTIHSQIWDG